MSFKCTANTSVHSVVLMQNRLHSSITISWISSRIKIQPINENLAMQVKVQNGGALLAICLTTIPLAVMKNANNVIY